MYNIERYMWKDVNLMIKSQRSIANKVGINECHLSRIINRRLSCPKTTALAIANALDGKLLDYFERV